MQAKLVAERDMIIYEFCAKFLPALYATWLKHDTPRNAHLRMLNTISYAPYFVVFATRTQTLHPFASI